MAKYVCDFEQVYTAGEKVCQAASELSTAISNYSSHIDSDLSTWTGNAKGSFTTTNTSQVQLANQNATYVNALGEFIKTTSKSIQQLEEQLASLSI